MNNFQTDPPSKKSLQSPQLKYEKGYTIFNATVGMKNGLHARPSMRLVKLCNNYDKEVYIISEANPKLKVNAKGMMEMMFLRGVRGTRLEIMIEGTDDKSEKLALELYKGIELGGFDVQEV
ncbi:MAG: HPr family phosphocarrier protein [archaeon]